jgi:hypothetical protein
MFIVIIQVMHFDYIMHTMRKILFLLNPAAWVEVHTDRVDEWEEDSFQLRADSTKFRKTIHLVYTSKIIIFPPAIISMLMRLVVTWMVILDSVSIILTSESVLDTVWDCLAIGFLLELNLFWWQILHTVFHIEPLEATSFTVSYNKGVWATPNAKRSELSTLGRAKTMCPCVVNLFSRFLPCRDGHGGRRAESLIVSVFAYLLAIKQVFVVIRALETNVAPMARDVCQTYRLAGDRSIVGNIWAWFIENVIFVNGDKLAKLIVDEKGWDCNSEKYAQTVNQDMISSFKTRPWKIGGLAVGLFIFFFLPTLMDWYPKRFFTVFKKHKGLNVREDEEAEKQG